jgi:hypothetical protein
MAPVVSSIELTLLILLERLNWPVRMVRLVAAREYAGLLSSAVHGKTAAATYLRWLARRELESQVATGLAVLLCTAKDNLPPFSDVCKAIRQPSIITDLLLQHIYGLGNRRGGWHTAHSGVAPDDFVPEEYFENHKTLHVPVIFGNQIERLESKF